MIEFQPHHSPANTPSHPQHPGRRGQHKTHTPAKPHKPAHAPRTKHVSKVTHHKATKTAGRNVPAEVSEMLEVLGMAMPAGMC